jgi:hypothetical protein
MLSSTTKYSLGQSASGTCARISSLMRSMRSADRRRQRPAIDQQRRPLIAHAGARGGIDADQPVLGNLAPFDPQLVAQAIQQFDAAQHAVGDVVREEHAITARPAPDARNE